MQDLFKVDLRLQKELLYCYDELGDLSLNHEISRLLVLLSELKMPVSIAPSDINDYMSDICTIPRYYPALSVLAAEHLGSFLYSLSNTAGLQTHNVPSSLKLTMKQHHFDSHWKGRCQSRELKHTACCCADKESNGFRYFQPGAEV